MSTIWGFTDTYLDGVSWFVCIYLIIYCYKKFYHNYFKQYKNYLLLIAFTGYAMMAGITYTMRVYGNGNFSVKYPILEKLAAHFEIYLSDYKSIPNFLIAFMVFVFFQHMDISGTSTKAVINCIARNSLAVYLIHQARCFYPVLWVKILRCDIWPRNKVSIVYIVLSAVGIYISGCILDEGRRRLIAPFWLHSKLSYKLQAWLDAGL